MHIDKKKKKEKEKKQPSKYHKKRCFNTLYLLLFSLSFCPCPIFILILISPPLASLQTAVRIPNRLFKDNTRSYTDNFSSTRM